MFANCFIRGVKIPSAALYIVAVLLIVIYGIVIRKAKKRDILETKLVDNPVVSIDGWGMLHLVFFGILGVLFPGRYLQFLLVGIAWEGIETFLGQCRIMAGGSRIQLIGDQDEEGRPTGDDKAYWYGRSSDVLMNMIGYILGDAAAQQLNKK